MESRGPQWPLLILAVVFLLAGCVAAAPGANRNAGLQEAGPIDEIAALAADNSSGSRQISVSPFGGGAATLGESYFSALGVPCRKVIFLDYAGRRHDLAVCNESGGREWTTAPSIFGYSNNQ